ncbi:MAG: hypothetical protein JNM36_12745 [Chitinophagales bacterium]|nr:hypothetical protein [Chitinophagales bacterium]
MEEKIKTHIANKEWSMAVGLLYDLVLANPTDSRYTINLMYLLHDILLEQEYSDDENIYFAGLLEYLFCKSYPLFNNNAVYLFFIGKILHIAEWYLGIDEQNNVPTNTLAYRMQLAAWQKEPNNILYEWACRLTQGEEQETLNLAKQILSDDNYITWIKSILFVNDYITENLETTVSL